MSAIPKADADFVRARARNRCEYCQMHQAIQGATFHIEHVRPKSAGGNDQTDNLALACPSCNFSKADRTEVTGGCSNGPVRLFNPRLDGWSEHFEWSEERTLLGRTEVGQATIDALSLNHERRLRIREAEEWFDLFPPSDTPV